MIKLCYKEYDFKMSLKAMKQFKQATGKDLWYCLLQLLEAFMVNNQKGVMPVCLACYRVMDFETAAHAFHALFNGGGEKIPLEEIEDAMFRSGWLPVDHDTDMAEPWPMVMAVLATECDKQLKVHEAKKP